MPIGTICTCRDLGFLLCCHVDILKENQFVVNLYVIYTKKIFVLFKLSK